MKYLKKFQNHNGYESFAESEEFLKPNVSLCKTEWECHYTIVPYAERYLTFVALENGTFTLTIGSAVTTSVLESISYSLDEGETWTTTNNVNSQTVTITTPTINANDKVLWKGSGVGVSTTTNDSNRLSTSSIFSSSGRFRAEGNIMSLIYGDDFADKDYVSNGSSYNFALLFYSYETETEAKLVSCKNMVLPIRNVPTYCYFRMFQGVSALTTPMKSIDAESIGDSGCRSMFYGCTNLTTAPSLLATILSQYCCYCMFYNCSSLRTAPPSIGASSTTMSASACTYMFRDCTNLTTAPELPATTLATYCYYYMFAGCTSLTTTPSVLPATTLANFCYGEMFQGCSSLTTPPQLLATTLAPNCCQRMFGNCTSLTTAPQLLATTLTKECYISMFINCTSLTTAPQLPATILAARCYESMFYGTNVLPDCTNIDFTSPTVVASGGLRGLFGGTKVTDSDLMNILPLNENGKYCLPVTTLASWCYSSMFMNCKNLTTAPELPATILADNCYYAMFQSCTSLTTAPELPAPTLAQYCYASMFYGCTSLNSIICLAANISAPSCTSYWVGLVASNGTFKKRPSMTRWTRGNDGIPTNWTVEDAEYDFSKEYLTMDIVSGGTIVWKASSTATTVATVSYSKDNGSTWTDITSSTAGTSFNVSKGDRVLLKGNNASYANSSNGATTYYNTFGDSTAYFNLEGNIMSLISGDSFSEATTLVSAYTFTFLFRKSKVINAKNLILPATTLANWCYNGMFFNCKSLTTTPELQATTLAQACYESMFSNCTSLTTAPELPATTLASSCYYSMFESCTSLTTAPTILPATTLAYQCYYRMFYGCRNLTTAPVLLATTLANFCCYWMFQGCSGLTTAPELPATTLAQYCYYYMFSGCTSLTTAPELPATTLASQCYHGMFYGCRNLTTAPSVLPATTLAVNCYSSMFQGCTSLTTAPELPATTLAGACYINMFQGCTSLTTAPELPATTLASHCYEDMFSGCSHLNSITCLATDISAIGCTDDWVSGVAASGTFIKEKSMTGWTTGTDGIPTNWVVKDNYRMDYLTMDIVSAGTIVWKTSESGMIGKTISYSLNNGSTWTDIASTPDGVSINVSVGDKVLLKATNSTYGDNEDYYNTFSDSTAYFNLEGNIMSLIVGDNFATATTFASDYTFNSMFELTHVVSAEHLILPSTTLADGCYYNMFYNCESLTTAPELPATTLAEYCYQYMFQGCTSLTTAPELPATTLVTYCYSVMFRGCTNLTTAPELPATTLAERCYNNMFYDCTSLTTAPELPATTLADYCYNNMFKGCTSLTTAPELPATTLAECCYQGMFMGCTSLNSITCIATDISATNCTNNWVRGVSSTGTFTKAQSMTGWTTGNSGIPTNWTVQDATQGVLMTMYVDDFNYFDMVYDQIDDPGAYGCNQYTYLGTITRNGTTLYVWNNQDAEGTDYSYLLTTTNNYNTLHAQSLYNDIGNTFDAFVERCSSDYYNSYASSDGNTIYLVKAINNNGVARTLWIDDYEQGPLLINDEIENPESCGANKYCYYGDTIEYDGDTYYLWEMQDYDEGMSYNSNVCYLLTTTDNLNTLYSESLEDNFTNRFDSFAGRLNSDQSEMYGEVLTSQSLVKIVEGSVEPQIILRAWVDDFPSSHEYDEGSPEDKMDAEIADPEGEGANPYIYSGDTIEYNGDTYYLWALDPEWGWSTDAQYLVTSSVDFDDLYIESLKDDATNHFTSCIGQFNSDSELYIEQDIGEDNEIYLVAIEEL